MTTPWREHLVRLLDAGLATGVGRLEAGDEETAARFFEIGASYAQDAMPAYASWRLVMWQMDRADRSLTRANVAAALERAEEALATARKCWALAPDADAARLLVVCYLRLARFQAALDVNDAIFSRS